MKRYNVTRDMINKEATLKTLQGATREYHEEQGHTCYYYDTWCEEAHYTFTRCMNDNTLVPSLVSAVAIFDCALATNINIWFFVICNNPP